MGRLKGFGSFLVITGILFFALRLVHLGIPVFYPQVLAGPFSLDRIDTVSQYAGFSPRVPFYRPEELGTRPVNITVTRRPRPKVVIFWQGEHFLYLAEQQGGQPAPARPGERPLPGHPEATWWQEGRTRHVVLKLDDLWIELRTDLELEDVLRIIKTLRPYEELL